MTFLARGVWGSLPMVTISDPGPVWTIFSTSRRIFRRSMSRFLRTLAATPEPSLTSPKRMCSVPMYSWLKRCASWLANCITLRARSVSRSYMTAVPPLALPYSLQDFHWSFDDRDAGASKALDKVALELGEEIARLLDQVGEQAEAGDLALKHRLSDVPFPVDAEPRFPYAFKALVQALA